jgi:hypothetical protein
LSASVRIAASNCSLFRTGFRISELSAAAPL